VDEMVAAYAEWREASRIVRQAYRSWSSDTGVGAGDAFKRYTAALDLEEIAADVYADLVRLVARLEPWRTTRTWDSRYPRGIYRPTAG
jgi:hypothetical protein